MKFSKLTCIAATASAVLASPAAVTVTEHYHNGATVTVKGVVYISNGQAQTSYYTDQLSEEPTTTVTQTHTLNSSQIQQAAQTSTLTPSSSETPVTQTSAVLNTSSAIPSAVMEDQYFVTSSTASTLESSAPVPTPNTVISSSQAVTSQTLAAEQETTSATPTTAASSAISTATSASTDASSGDLASTLLNAHNNKRALHEDTPALSWSSDLASYAQNYADQYDCSGNLVHSGGQYGENLSLGYGIEGAVDAWYNEISSYNWANPGFSESTGHFTQVVWKSSTQVGCGTKSCGGSWGDYVVCSYNPAGNFIGEFADNVEPLA